MKIPLLSKVIDPIQATTGPVVQINGDASVHREPNLHYAFPLAPLTIKPSRVPKASDMPLHTLKPLITLCCINSNFLSLSSPFELYETYFHIQVHFNC